MHFHIKAEKSFTQKTYSPKTLHRDTHYRQQILHICISTYIWMCIYVHRCVHILEI